MNIPPAFDLSCEAPTMAMERGRNRIFRFGAAVLEVNVYPIAIGVLILLGQEL